MNDPIKADICIIGGGSAGLSVAAGAAQMGARTVLIESGRMGGDCLNTGCVPSKSLLAAAHAAHCTRTTQSFGIKAGPSEINFQGVHDHIHDVIASITPHDSQERFEALGCTVFRTPGRFIDERTVEAGGIWIKARRFVIATGSRAAVPPIPGLNETPHHTNESIFDLTEAPSHLVIIGAGPIGCEMAQAFRRLGSKVTLLDMASMMPRDDQDAVAVVRQTFADEGITVKEGVSIERVEKAENGLSVTLQGEEHINGSHLLIAAGRRPNVENLGLDEAGVAFSPKGVNVDDRLRTTNHRVFAAGDVAGGPQFTHWAGYHAGVIIRNALFRLPAKVDVRALPWVTYTDPELAQVGLTERDARERYGDSLKILHAPFADNDRARAEHRTEGFVKAIVDRRGRVLGATIVGQHAGELIQTWGLAISGGFKIGKLAGMIAPYPTLSEINKRAAGSFFTPTLFSPRTQWLVRMLGYLG